MTTEANLRGRLFLYSLELLINYRPRKAIDCDVQPITLFTLHYKIL